MGQRTIGKIARHAAIRASAIRYYERIGLLPEPERVHGHRRYDDDILRRLTVIAAARQMGFTIAEIQTLFHGFAAETPAAARWQTLATGKLIEIDARIARAQTMKQLLEGARSCACLSLDACADAFQSHRPAGIP